MNEITAYQCEHCTKKIYTSKHVCKAHEKMCYSNPATRSCVTCDWFKPNSGEFCRMKIDVMQTRCETYNINPEFEL